MARVTVVDQNTLSQHCWFYEYGAWSQSIWTEMFL